MALKCDAQHMQERVDLALKLGWTIDSDGYLSAPKHFECCQYGTILKVYPLKQGQVHIPHYFDDDYVMTTGTWKEQVFDDNVRIQEYYRV